MNKNYIRLLKEGLILAYPTETVWGLGVDIRNSKALTQLYELKGRKDISPMSVLVRDMDMASELVEINENAKRVLMRFWPGPLTAILPVKKTVQKNIDKRLLSDNRWLGLRCSSHSFIQQLFVDLDFPICTTSANPSGYAEYYPEKKCRDWLSKHSSVVIVDWNSSEEIGLASTVLQFTSPLKLLREGPISFQDINREYTIRSSM